MEDSARASKRCQGKVERIPNRGNIQHSCQRQSGTVPRFETDPACFGRTSLNSLQRFPTVHPAGPHVLSLQRPPTRIFLLFGQTVCLAFLSLSQHNRSPWLSLLLRRAFRQRSVTSSPC